MKKKKQPSLSGSVLEIVKGGIFPTKAPVPSPEHRTTGWDLLKFGMGLTSPSLIKIDVNMGGNNTPQPVVEQQQFQQQIPSQQPQIVNNYYNYYGESTKPIDVVSVVNQPTAIPETCDSGITTEENIESVEVETKFTNPAEQLVDTINDIKKDNNNAKLSGIIVIEENNKNKQSSDTIDIPKEAQQKQSTAALRGFIPVPEKNRSSNNSRIISPMPGLHMDIVKTDDDNVDLSQEAIQQDQAIMDGVINTLMGNNNQQQYPQQQYPPQYPQQYPPQQYMGGYPQYNNGMMYPPQIPFQQPIQYDTQNINVDLGNVNFDTKDKPAPNKWPDSFQSKLPSVEKQPFINKYDNSELFIKFPELAHVQLIAERNNVHVKFSEEIYENGYQDSRIVRVDSFNEEGSYIYFKSFYIDYKNIIDSRIKVFADINSTLEGQQAYSLYYIPTKKEKREGYDTSKKVIDDKLFNDIFSGGVMMLDPDHKKGGLYSPNKIRSNIYCVLISIPSRGLKSDDRARIIGIIQMMSNPGGVFDTALSYCPGSRWKFDVVDGRGMNYRNFELTNVNVPLTYGAIPRAVVPCKIISCIRNKQHKIVININDNTEIVYTVSKECNNITLDIPEQQTTNN